MDDIAVSRLGDVAIDGAAALVYLGEPTGRGQGPSMGGKMRFYVLKDRGLPRRMEMLDASDKPTMTVDFRDYDAPITIQLPPCGQKT